MIWRINFLDSTLLSEKFYICYEKKEMQKRNIERIEWIDELLNYPWRAKKGTIEHEWSEQEKLVSPQCVPLIDVEFLEASSSRFDEKHAVVRQPKQCDTNFE